MVAIITVPPLNFILNDAFNGVCECKASFTWTARASSSPKHDPAIKQDRNNNIDHKNHYKIDRKSRPEIHLQDPKRALISMGRQ